ncbi:MAG: hypothetical protein ACPGGK_09170 [Pikeienuella sp.]
MSRPFLAAADEFNHSHSVGGIKISDRELHLVGLSKLIEPTEKQHLRRAFATQNSREKWLRRLCHDIEMHPDFSNEPPRGSRDENSLFKRLIDLGAPQSCYVIASDSDLDDSFQPLHTMIATAHLNFNHGTILSCVPGRLALFRTAHPCKHIIAHRV